MEKIERQTSILMELAWSGLYPAAGDNDDYGDDNPKE
jgi:hypothetical protein